MDFSKRSQLLRRKLLCMECSTLSNDLNGPLLQKSNHGRSVITQHTKKVQVVAQHLQNPSDLITLNVLPNLHSGRNRAQLHRWLCPRFVRERLSSLLLSFTHR